MIIALYMTHVGEIVPISFLSNILEFDVGSVIDRLGKSSNGSGFLLVRRNGNVLDTVPSIGAKNILKHLFSDAEIVNTIVPILGRLAKTYPRSELEKKMLNQMMRYSILNGVVTDKEQINNFFNHNTQLRTIRRMPLFWLQWHMAKTDEGEFITAEKYLEQGYKEAEDYDKRSGNTWNRKQLDDRRAKFLMIRATKTPIHGAELFKNFQEAQSLTGKLLQDQILAHYPYQTLEALTIAFNAKRRDLIAPHQNHVFQELDKLFSKASSQLKFVAEGYQRKTAENVLSRIEPIIVKLR